MGNPQPNPVGGEAYYLDNYADYSRQNSHRKLAFYCDQVRALFSATYQDSPRVHDIGCAFGDFLLALPSTWERYGSDPNAYAIQNAHINSEQIRLARGSGCTDVLFDQPFDLITAFDVIEHVEDIEKARSVIGSQLKPDGYFVFVVPVYDGLTGPIIQRLDKDPTHVHKLARSRWLEWAAIDFEVLHWQGIIRYFIPGLHYYLHLPTYLFRQHVPAIFVVCRNR